MRWRLYVLCALSFAGLLGCPRAFGRGGTLEAAARKDIEEYTQMGKALRDGSMQEDIRKHRPTLSPTKLEDFAAEFARAYQGA